ncbi:hypothetical protein BGZ79_002231, partial [Entomortierella chlamydospora]
MSLSLLSAALTPEGYHLDDENTENPLLTQIKELDKFFYDRLPAEWLPEKYAAVYGGQTSGFVAGLKILVGMKRLPLATYAYKLLKYLETEAGVQQLSLLGTLFTSRVASQNLAASSYTHATKKAIKNVRCYDGESSSLALEKSSKRPLSSNLPIRSRKRTASEFAAAGPVSSLVSPQATAVSSAPSTAPSHRQDSHEDNDNIDSEEIKELIDKITSVTHNDCDSWVMDDGQCVGCLIDQYRQDAIQAMRRRELRKSEPADTIIMNLPRKEQEEQSEETLVANIVAPILRTFLNHVDDDIFTHFPNTESNTQRKQGLKADKPDFKVVIGDKEASFGEVTGRTQRSNKAKNGWDIYRLVRFGKSVLDEGAPMVPLVQIIYDE